MASNLPFPVLSAAEMACVAASLASGACALAAGHDGLTTEAAVELSQRLFQRQMQFLADRKWPDTAHGFLADANWG